MPDDAKSNTTTMLASGTKARFISPELNTATFIFKCLRGTKARQPTAGLCWQNLRTLV
jgi:hypothetical protein